jgi:hypothetical protein
MGPPDEESIPAMSAGAPEHDDPLRLVTELLLSHVSRSSVPADTLDGITKWWLGDIGARINPSVLRQALTQLVQRGVLGCRSLPSGEILWFAVRGDQPPGDGLKEDA